jgi:hypothetical protein
MFPIREATLSFGEISDYWSREIQPPASADELLDLLVGAWWLAEIRSRTGATRLELLKRMFERMYGNGDTPIVFIVGHSTAPPLQELPDGGLQIDLRPRISVPSSNIGIWDEDNCSDAFKMLAQTCSSYPDHKPGFLSFKLTYEEFTDWLEKRRYPRPKFWDPIPALTKPKAGRPEKYNWEGVRTRLVSYVSQHGRVKTWNELLQKCADFASELHPSNETPSDKTIRDAIKTHRLDRAAGLAPGN